MLLADRQSERFEIVDDGGGFTVFRYLDGANTHDYFQHNLAMAQLCAADHWGVTESLWRVPHPNELPLG